MNEANAFLEEAKRIRADKKASGGGPGGDGGAEEGGEETGAGEQTGARTVEDRSSPSKAKLDVKGKGKA